LNGLIQQKARLGRQGGFTAQSSSTTPRLNFKDDPIKRAYGFIQCLTVNCATNLTNSAKGHASFTNLVYYPMTTLTSTGFG